ncbi:O-fucosyltransferase 10-like [Coffea eugenioides]|uniref:O-fucosyltransferase 10-like n=1 Tax=Coffea eugenioides TaxID=49369 RepID=UPI000F607FDB|nr:O-fucosyltransferase 10-like [Coffea eugenioides]
MASDANNASTTNANSSTSSPHPTPTTTSSGCHSHQHCRHKAAHFHRRRGKSATVSLAGVFRRRSLLLRCLLVLPLTLYFSGVITFTVGPLLAILRPAPPPGSVYRSHEVFEKLWPDIHSDNSSSIELSSIWRYRRKLGEQKSCPNGTARQGTESPTLDRYLIIEANGGLNQQRSSICSAVALAGLLGATLVIPRLEFHSVWQDSSEFADIYDEEHFIFTLKDFVTVVRELPEEIMKTYDFNISSIPNIRVQAWAPASYYLGEVYPVLLNQRVVRISPFANRLSMNVPPHIQFLRCLTNYKALRFSSAILNLAQKLVNRVTEKSSSYGGKYVSIHLRFEEDMVAFSCCLYDGGKSEKFDMDAIREKGWGKKFKSSDHVISPGLNRMNGRCPMTPLEVGMMLRGMGFANDTPIYLASGKIYQADRNLMPLRKMFPLLQTKNLLATEDELAEFQGYSSRLAALDYAVCLFSEVFVSTQGGNFPHFLMGHRRFLYNGHAKTIKPNKPKLALLLHNTSIRWDAFKNEMQSMLAEIDKKGTAVPIVKKSRRKASIYSNPLPECRCLLESKNISSAFMLKAAE